MMLTRALDSALSPPKMARLKRFFVMEAGGNGSGRSKVVPLANTCKQAKHTPGLFPDVYHAINCS